MSLNVTDKSLKFLFHVLEQYSLASTYSRAIFER